MDKRIKNLCKRANNADKDAICELLKIYYSDIYAYLRRLSGSRADAEDLTQQTFLKAWTSLDGFSGYSKLLTWIYRIAHNTYIDWLRSKTNNTQNHSEKWWLECIDSNPGPFTNAAERQFAQHIYEVVDSLDEDKKHIIHLHYYQGLSIRETADVLGIAKGTVKYRLREVFKTLNVKLAVQEKEKNLITNGESL